MNNNIFLFAFSNDYQDWIFYVFINNFVSSSKKCSVYLTITDCVICSVGICVCRLYVLGITPLSKIVLLRKLEIFLLSEVSPYFIISVTVHKVLVFCISFFFPILFIAWARRILFRKSFLYLYFKFCPLYSEVQTKKNTQSSKKRKIPTSKQPGQGRHLEPQTNMARNDSSHTTV